MQPIFDFDHLCRLARHDPAAFEAQRQALFEAALAEIPPAKQGAARVALAEVQVRMSGARNPAERLAVAVAAMADSVGQLQRELCALHREASLHGGIKTCRTGTVV